MPMVLHAPGGMQETAWATTQQRIELRLEDGRLLDAGSDAPVELREWVERASAAIRSYYGSFPARQTSLLLERVNGEGVQWARTFSYSGAFVRVGLGENTAPAQLASDWVLTHEFVHLALPQLNDEHDWLQEGAATYVEPIARARAGLLSAEQVWSDFARDMHQGLPGPKDRGLDLTPSWGRTYWGGALFCLIADVEIRKRTDNRLGLQDALRAILAEGGTLANRWAIRETLRHGDRATGSTVLSDLYEQWRIDPVHVDLEALWRNLGVERRGRSAMLHDDAPLAHIRRAITAPVDG
jgi:hypothetical protein